LNTSAPAPLVTSVVELPPWVDSIVNTLLVVASPRRTSSASRVP